MPREKSRYRDRRSTSNSSGSSRERKKSKSKHRKRSRSRDRSESSSHRRKRSTSRSKHRRRSYSRSVSRERYESSSRPRRSTSRSRSKRSRHSREHSHSRSRSHSRSKYSKTSRKHKRRSPSSSRESRASSFDIEPRKLKIDDTEIKIEKAIKAAEAAGLTMTKIPTYEYKEVEVKEDMPTIHDRNLIAELNSDSFVQRSFTSSRSKKQSQSIVIDLNAETVKLPTLDIKIHNEDSIVNFEEIPSHEELKEIWIKKLYQYRKKMLRDEIQY